MSQLFSSAASVKAEKETDTLGGGFKAFESGVYTATIQAIYATTAQSGARALNLIADIDGRKYSETLYVTNKKGEFTYKDKKEKDRFLPGYLRMNAIFKLAGGVELPAAVFEPRIVKVYDFEQRKEVGKEVPVATDLIGKQVKLGIVRIIRNKEKKDQEGNYVPTSELRTVNEIENVFHVDSNKTVNEVDDGLEAKFHDAWVEARSGKDIDKTVAGTASASTTGTQTGSAAGGSSFFGD